MALTVARTRLPPPLSLAVVLAVGVVASAASASRAVAIAYAVALLAVAWKRQLTRFFSLIFGLALLLNVATRSRTLIIPEVLGSEFLERVYATPESVRAALDVAPSESVGANVIDFVGRRALGLDELNLAVTFPYPKVSLMEGLAGVANSLGLRVEGQARCPSMEQIYSFSPERFGGMNLDPLGRLWAASCGSTGAYVIALIVSGALFSLLIAGGMALNARWGVEVALVVVLLLGFALWFDSRYTVLRFGLVTLILAVTLDRRLAVHHLKTK